MGKMKEATHLFANKFKQDKQILWTQTTKKNIRDSWYKLLPDIAITYNTTTFQDMWLSPYEIMFNRKPKNTTLAELNIFPQLSIYHTILEEFTPDVKQAFVTLDLFWS